jgi:small-conductance mechanosensitive channel
LRGMSTATGWIGFGPQGNLQLFGITLIGVNAENGKKLLFTLILIALVIFLGMLLRGITHLLLASRRNDRIFFWTKQGIRLLMLLILVFGFTSIWFSDPTRLGTFLGLVTAGVAFALQRVITAFAAYFIILRGKNFNVGDRIVMGGVRGDVIDLGFMQTRVMEMGQPPGVNDQTDPAMWVRARQYTGRIVTITNDKIFDTPVYNYTREFPYIWDEIRVPISFKDDRERAESILLEAAEKHTTKVAELGEQEIKELERRYVMRRAEIRPKVFWRITDNWLEMTLRFLAPDHGIRGIKDAMARQILGDLEAAGIGIASTTFEIVGLPALRVQREEARRSNGR